MQDQKGTLYKSNEYKLHLENITNFNTEIVVSGYIVKDNKVCLIDHKDLKMWLPPGGHININEDPISAIEREVLEEVGWEIELVEDDRLFCEEHVVWKVPRPRYFQYEIIKEAHAASHVHVNLVYFCKAIKKVKDPDLIEGTIQWFEMNQLDNLDRLYAHTKINAIAAIREIGSIVPSSLRPENGRVLVPIGGRCPYNCTYCYTKRHDVYFGEPDPQRIYLLLEKLIEKEGNKLTAQIGYDNDPFADSNLGLDILTKLTWLPIHVGFSTKAPISEKVASYISSIRNLKNENGYNVSALVTLTSIESAKELEPNAPSPLTRLKSVTELRKANIPVMINLRPILPDQVSEQEFFNVIRLSKEAGAIGIILGAFWDDPEGIVSSGLRPVKSQYSEIKIPWAPHTLSWKRYEDEKVFKKLSEFATSIGLKSFESSASAVKYLNKLTGDLSKYNL